MARYASEYYSPDEVYPTEPQAQSGIVFGPNGNDFTGTLVAGGGSSGGGDATLANQQAMLDLLSAAGRVDVVSNVRSGGTITLYIGDDDVGDNAVRLPVDDVGGVLHSLLTGSDTTSVRFGAGVRDQADQIVGSIDRATITHSESVTTVPIEITASDKSGPASEHYEYHIKQVDSDGNEKVKAAGRLELRVERASEG